MFPSLRGASDGRGMAMIYAGADAVQVGTRFAYECTVHENYKKRIFNAKDIDTIVTGRRTGHPVRILKNKLSRRFIELDQRLAPR